MSRALVTAALSFAVACGGTVIVGDDDGGGGSGGSGKGTGTTGATKSTSAGPSTAVTTSSGPTFCDDHTDCGSSIGDDVCVFSGSFCAKRCGPGSPPCPPSFRCVECATSSCPACGDCIGACLVAQ